MKRISLTNTGFKKLKQGCQMLTKNDIKETNSEGYQDFVNFTYQNKIVGTGYLGEENRSVGWVITTTSENYQISDLKETFQKAKAKRSSYFNNVDITNAFRIFNGIADGFGGLTIDYYNGYAVMSLYNATIANFTREIANLLLEVFPEVKGVYAKFRYKQATTISEFVIGEQAPEPLIIKENNINFATYLNEGLMTGIFLDQHNVRKRLVEGFACGEKVLNLFSYTGAFSIASAMGGAVETTSVDLAKRSLEKTREMFTVNNLDYNQHKIIVMDVFAFCKWAAKKGLKYDVIILDPPSFARNGKKTFTVAKDYGKLIAAIIPLLNKNAKVIASTNAANVSLAKFRTMIETEFQKNNIAFEELMLDKLPADFVTIPSFKEGDYLKVITYKTTT